MIDTKKQKLDKLEEFKSVLKDYMPSKESIDILQDTKFILLVGPTAAGRNTLINILLDTNRYHFVVSDTTRKKRYNSGVLEKNGLEYWFKSENDVLQGLKEGLYLEAAIIHNQQVSGISVDELIKAHNIGKIPINEIEVVGASKINSYSSNALFIFLLPPTFDVWMDRLRNRGEVDEEEVKRRLISAQNEIAEALNQDFYQFVINNEIHEAAQAVDELANGRRPDPEKQQKGRNHAEQLALDVQLYLKNS